MIHIWLGTKSVIIADGDVSAVAEQVESEGSTARVFWVMYVSDEVKGCAQAMNKLNGHGHAGLVNERSVQLPTTCALPGETQYKFVAHTPAAPQHALVYSDESVKSPSQAREDL